MSGRIAVLVASCDSYSDLWDPFFKFFFKYWADCPFKIYLSTNFKDYFHERITVIKCKKVSNWSDELKTVLNQIKEEHILITLEDYFIYKKVDNRYLNEIISKYKKLDAVYMRVGTFPSQHNALWNQHPLSDYPGFVKIETGSLYRVNLQVCLWRKNYLCKLLVDGETPWRFEIEGSKRTQSSNELFLGLQSIKGEKEVHGPIYYIAGAVTGGLLMRKAMRIAKQNNIELNTDSRKVQSWYSHYRRYIYTSLPIGFRKVIDKLLGMLSVKNA